jgi:thioredoxin reductase
MSLYDVVIVGGGPAGLAAARYCLHAHLNAVIVTPELGGKVNEPFALRDLRPADADWGAPLVTQFEQIVADAKELPHITQEVVKITQAEAGHFTLRLANESGLDARTVIVATGATPQRLYVEGEKEFLGQGVSFSAISHAPYFAGRDVAVVGGHRRTLLAALELAPIARQVYLMAGLSPSMAQLPAAERLLAVPNVTFFKDWEVQAIVGDEYVTGINLVGINGETRQLAVDGVFVQMALLPNSEAVRDLVELDEEGHVLINQRCETSVPGLFAAGDVTNIHSEQLLAAMGEGTKAALGVWEYLATNS